MKKKKSQKLLAIPLDFKHTVLAALETKPEKRKQKPKNQSPPKKAG
jgi:hypothetical protein